MSCSGSKSAQKVEEEAPQIELSSTDEFADNTTDQAEVTENVEPVTPENTEEIVTSNTEPLVQESSLENVSQVSPNIDGEIGKYTVSKNETLMMIAFNIYGDYSRWKEIANLNSGLLKGGSKLSAGMILSFVPPKEKFVLNPQGNPYLIKTGDTLGTISKDVYSTPSKWKLIWENNRPLIKNPNKIYAGFTIYYLDNNREVANQL
jgi:nucleoid-associated protein YgaU